MGGSSKRTIMYSDFGKLEKQTRGGNDAQKTMGIIAVLRRLPLIRLGSRSDTKRGFGLQSCPAL